MRRLLLRLESVQDLDIREALRRLFEELFLNVFLGFRGRHIVITMEPGTYTIPHRLGFSPKDIIQTSARNGTCSFDYDSIDETDLVFTLTGTAGEDTVVRAFIGTYRED